jgi:hypothetical protein
MTTTEVSVVGIAHTGTKGQMHGDTLGIWPHQMCIMEKMLR